jgi:hypothetical protein
MVLPGSVSYIAHLRDEALIKASTLAGDIIEQATKTQDQQTTIANA